MTMDKAHQHLKCKTCRASTCTGPFAYCIFNPNSYFKGACTNCQAKSTAKDCSSKGTCLYSYVYLITNLYIAIQILKPKDSEAATESEEADESEDKPDEPTPKRRKYDQKKTKYDQARSSKNAPSYQVSNPVLPKTARTPAYNPQPQAYSSVQRQPALNNYSWIGMASDECLTALSREISQEMGRRAMQKLDQPTYMDGQDDNDVFNAKTL